MKISSFVFFMVISLFFGCNDPLILVQEPPASEEDSTAVTFVDTAYQVLEDCILENYPILNNIPPSPEGRKAYDEQIIAYGVPGFSILKFYIGSDFIASARPKALCAKCSVIDSNGMVLQSSTDTNGYDASSFNTSTPDDFVCGDTLFLADYLLADWPEGRPGWDHVIYTRIKANGDTARYAFPRLCGKYMMIDEDGQPAYYFIGVGACAGYQEMINK